MCYNVRAERNNERMTALRSTLIVDALVVLAAFGLNAAGKPRSGAPIPASGENVRDDCGMEAGMFPFVPSFGELAPLVDMSSLLAAPAGRNGHIRVKDGHFADDRGRVRLNGVNLVGPANFRQASSRETHSIPRSAIGRTTSWRSSSGGAFSWT